MLLPKKHIVTLSLAACVLASPALAGLYGFASANPYSEADQTAQYATPPKHLINHRKELRNNLEALVMFAKKAKPDFQIIIHEGTKLLNKSWREYNLDLYNKLRSSDAPVDDPTFLSEERGSLPPMSEEELKSFKEFTAHVDGVLLNNMFCSKRKPVDFGQDDHYKIISVDKCYSQNLKEEAIQEAGGNNMLSYAFVKNETPFGKRKDEVINENSINVMSLKDAKNITLLLDHSAYAEKYELLHEIEESNYDVVIIPTQFNRGSYFSKDEIYALKFKKNGTRRLVIAQVNITEANPKDFFFKKNWVLGNPQWLARPSLVDETSIIAEYWNENWRKIMASYFRDIINIGYDGAFITGTENYAYFEKKTPLE